MSKVGNYDRKWKRNLGNVTENPNSVWDQLAELEKQCVLVRPENSFTVMEYAAKRGLNRNAAAHLLNRLHELGKVEKIKGTASSKIYWRISK